MDEVRIRSAAPERMHALDAVRGFALLLGIVFHATMSFIPAPVRLWPVEDSHRSLALAGLFFTTHVFRMMTFFLIAGFFARLMIQRRGVRGFVADRLKRIALPLVVGWPILFAAIIAVSIWASVSGNGGVAANTPTPPWPTFPNFPLTHLWFLYVLLEFYAAMLIARAVTGALDRQGRWAARVDAATRTVMRGPFAPMILALPLALAFAADEKWLIIFGIPTPDSSFVTNLQALIGFGGAFAFGWLLHRQIDLMGEMERRWRVNLSLAIGLIVACLAIGAATHFQAATGWLRFVGAVAYAMASWTSTFAVIGVAQRFLSGFSPVRRYIADSSYWLYLIHLPIVLALQAVVSRWDLPWPVKFAAILIVAFGSMFASYQLLVRHSFIGAVLNGRRQPRRATPGLPSGMPLSETMR